jgi:CRISPR system Cascade subunit CasC
MFVQIHILQSMPPSNLNRDDSGQPKKCIFGGVTRARISSQCLKRNIRLSPYFQHAFGEAVAKRTKYLPRLVAEAVQAAAGIPASEIDGIKTGIASQFKKETKSEEQDGDAETSASDVTPQLVFFQPAFAAKIATLLADLRKKHPHAYKRFIGEKVKLSKEDQKAADEAIQNFRDAALKAKESLSVDVGLFGRMTTSDIVADVEAACQVAHAISTHETLIESDYFTAMDDLQNQFITSQTQSGGAAFLGSGDTETFFNAAVYYKYLNIDTDGLLKNLGDGDVKKVSRAAGVMVEASALATPTGKQNSFAAHSVPEFVLVEVSQRKQPISYANAFLRPVEGDDLMRASVDSMSDYCGSVGAAFAPAGTKRFLLSVGRAKDAAFPLEASRVATLGELVAAVEKAVATDHAGA